MVESDEVLQEFLDLPKDEILPYLSETDKNVLVALALELKKRKRKETLEALYQDVLSLKAEFLSWKKTIRYSSK